jgi:hypothetical protein
MAMSGGTKASAEDPAGRGFKGFGRRNCQGKEEEREFRIRRAANRQGFGPDGEPAGNPERASALDGLRRMRGQDPVLVTAPRNRPLRKACLGGTGREGTVGPGSNAGPHYCLGLAADPPARHSRESGNLPAFPRGQGERKWDSGFRRNDEREWAVLHSPHCRTGPTWINPLSPLPSPQPA